MKKTFSKHWKASKQPRKQRKYLARAPIHIKRKLFSAHLSKELRKKHQRRSFTLRKGDTVKIMRGSFKGKTGKIASLDSRRKKVSIEGVQRAKRDGTKVNIFFDSSNLQIQELNLEDKERIKSIERKIREKEVKAEKSKKEGKTKEKKIDKEEKK